jgi:hypothetical protein
VGVGAGAAGRVVVVVDVVVDVVDVDVEVVVVSFVDGAVTEVAASSRRNTTAPADAPPITRTKPAINV